DIIRYFMTIPEACSLVLEAGCMGRGGEIYIFDMGKPVKIYDLACRMISLAGLKLGQDIQIVETGLRPGEKLYEELLNDKELTVPTHHQKIMIAKVRTYDYIDVMNHLEQLRNAINNCDTHSLVAEMKHIVPEYHSNNSKYEAIDREIEGEEKPDNLKEINTQIP
ncbi:MAG: polysaccharide biosynthesis protein, partial [Muribaculaceae bacterium]|nr:polysaccharide biosynthesis protein [Muribaculaceae bacterium]